MSTPSRLCPALVMVLAAAGQLAAADDAAPTAAPAPAAAPAAAPAEPDQRKAHDESLVHGFLRTRFQGRWTAGAADRDIITTLSLDAGDAKRDRVTAHFLGDGSVDLDGHTTTEGSYQFDSQRDSTGQDIVGRVYSAYLDIHRVGPLAVRLGRQSVYETPEISYFDGVRIDTEDRSLPVQAGAYAGWSVHLYQGYAKDDHVGGAYAEARPWKDGRTRLDWQRIEGRNGDFDYRSDLVSLAAWQRLAKHVDLHVRYTRQNNDSRDLFARCTLQLPEDDFRTQASYYELIKPRRGDVADADVYYPILKDYQPYREIRVLLSKGFASTVNLDLGVDIRRLDHDKQSSTFNHEFDRYFATIALHDLVAKGTSFSVTGERWYTRGRHYESMGADLSALLGRTRLSAGTAHYLYEYDQASDQERVEVQTWYVKAEHRYNESLRLRLTYEYENDVSAHYNELRCEAICNF